MCSDSSSAMLSSDMVILLLPWVLRYPRNYGYRSCRPRENDTKIRCEVGGLEKPPPRLRRRFPLCPALRHSGKHANTRYPTQPPSNRARVNDATRPYKNTQGQSSYAKVTHDTFLNYACRN